MIKINKQLVLNIVATIINFFVGLGINFGITPYIIHTLGADVYGFLPLANNFTGYILIVTTALNSVANRFITIKVQGDDLEGANVYYNSMFFSNVLLSAMATVLLGIFIVLIDKALDIPSHALESVRLLFLFVFSAFIIKLLFSVFNMAVYCKNRMDILAKQNIAEAIIRGSVTIALFCLFTPSIAYVGFVIFLNSIIFTAINIFITKRLTPFFKLNIKKFKMSAVKEMTSLGIWNSFNQLSRVLLTGLDLLISNIFLGADIAGVISITKTIPAYVQTLLSSISGAMVPHLTILYAKKQFHKLIEHLMYSVKFFGIMTNLMVTFLVVFGGDFYRLWVPGQNADLLQLLTVITLVNIFATGCMQPVLNIFTLTKRLKIPSIMVMISGILNTILVFLFLQFPGMGIYAIVSISSILGCLLNLLFTPIYAAKCLEVPAKMIYMTVGRVVCGFFISLAALFLISYFIKIQSWIMLFSIMMLSGIISGVINYFLVLKKQERGMLWNIIFGFIKRRRMKNV